MIKLENIIIGLAFIAFVVIPILYGLVTIGYYYNATEFCKNLYNDDNACVSTNKEYCVNYEIEENIKYYDKKKIECNIFGKECYQIGNN